MAAGQIKSRQLVRCTYDLTAFKGDRAVWNPRKLDDIMKAVLKEHAQDETS